MWLPYESRCLSHRGCISHEAKCIRCSMFSCVPSDSELLLPYTPQCEHPVEINPDKNTSRHWSNGFERAVWI